LSAAASGVAAADGRAVAIVGVAVLPVVLDEPQAAITSTAGMASAVSREREVKLIEAL